MSSGDADEIDDEKTYLIRGFDDIEIYRTQIDFVGLKQSSAIADDAIIVVPPERIDQLINALRAVKDEILTDLADEAASRTQRNAPPLNG